MNPVVTLLYAEEILLDENCASMHPVLDIETVKLIQDFARVCAAQDEPVPVQQRLDPHYPAMSLQLDEHEIALLEPE